MGAGAAAPGFYGMDGGRGGCVGSALARARGGIFFFFGRATERRLRTLLSSSGGVGWLPHASIGGSGALNGRSAAWGPRPCRWPDGRGIAPFLAHRHAHLRMWRRRSGCTRSSFVRARSGPSMGRTGHSGWCLVGVLLAAEMGVGAASPGIFGEVDGHGDCVGSATAGARGASAGPDPSGRRPTAQLLCGGVRGVASEAWQGAALRLQRWMAPRRAPWLWRLVFMLELGRAGQVWAWEGSIWS
jgi:hypothetical protein